MKQLLIASCLLALLFLPLTDASVYFLPVGTMGGSAGVPGANGLNATLPGNDTASLGGGLLTAASCVAANTTVAGARLGMAAVATPDTYPGDGSLWMAFIAGNDTVTTKLCAIATLTPTASVYHVRVIV